jgi:hypothetical protein
VNVDIQRPLAAAHAAAKAKGGKIVSLAQIASYLQADPAKVAIAMQHLAVARSAVEVAPANGCWCPRCPTRIAGRGSTHTDRDRTIALRCGNSLLL